jgi:hypothetical protein
MPLERALAISSAMFVGGGMLLGTAVWEWRDASFGQLNYPRTMRLVIPGMTLAALGFQSFMSSWFVSILAMRVKQDRYVESSR